MVSKKKPASFMDKLRNFLAPKPKTRKQQETDRERLRHVKNTAEFLSGEENPHQRSRRAHPERQAANDEALRKLNGRSENTRRQPKKGRIDEPTQKEHTRPAAAHSRRQKVKTDHRDNSDRMRSDNRHRHPHDNQSTGRHRDRPRQEPEPTPIQPSQGSTSSHMQSLDSRGGGGRRVPGPRSNQPKFAHIEQNRDGNKNSMHISTTAPLTKQRKPNPQRQPTDRHTRFADFMSPDAEPVEPVSPLSPEPPLPPIKTIRRKPTPREERIRQELARANPGLAICQMCERNPTLERLSALGYHLCAECKKRAFTDDGSPTDVDPVSPLTPSSRTSDARLQQFDFMAAPAPASEDRDRKRAEKSRGAKARNLTGYEQTAYHHHHHQQREKEAEREGHHPARSHAKPAPPLPQPQSHQVSPDTQVHRKHTSSIYSLTGVLPPSILPPASIPTTTTAPLQQPYNPPVPPLPSDSSSHDDGDVSPLSPSPVSARSMWTTDWSGYDPETIREAITRGEGGKGAIPPVPPVPGFLAGEEGGREADGRGGKGKEKEGERRDTRFYGFYDNVIGYEAKGPGRVRRYNGL
ncbi:MAG: hypothetical protein HETSPECPRED_006092 [Heterodermia speciosa]|uniref:Uncharacterized protein n=1 Tax=Heterodermia speciosa TaxID=116794 RepID=A0A8H3EFF8_9LECA|nr:MAG: hypothetical protein HETSPECPRED_006092 [Heterodermia speciosa]